MPVFRLHPISKLQGLWSLTKTRPDGTRETKRGITTSEAQKILDNLRCGALA